MLVAAADADPTLAELLDTLEGQRLKAARQIAMAVRDRGGLPAGTSLEQARDVIWIANSPELFTLAAKRRWSLERYVVFVRRTLLQIVEVEVER